jgi:hypothetical protein
MSNNHESNNNHSSESLPNPENLNGSNGKAANKSNTSPSDANKAQINNEAHSPAKEPAKPTTEKAEVNSNNIASIKSSRTKLTLPPEELELLGSIRIEQAVVSAKKTLEKPLMQKDCDFLVDQILKMSSTELDKLVGNTDALSKTLNVLFSHEIPDSKSVANLHIANRLNAHTRTARVLTAISAVCAITGFQSIVSGITHDRSVLSRIGGGLMSVGVFLSIQKVFKEDLLDNTTYDESKLKPIYKEKTKVAKNGQITSLRRQKLKELFNTKTLVAAIGVSASFGIVGALGYLAELPDGDVGSVLNYQQKELIKSVNTRAENDTIARSKILSIQQEINQLKTIVSKTPLDAKQTQELSKLTQELELNMKQNSVFALYSKQNDLELKRARCVPVLEPIGSDGKTRTATLEERSVTKYQDCALFNNEIFIKGKSLGRPKYEIEVTGGTLRDGTKVKGLVKEIEEAGGEYKFGELPITQAMKNKQTLEKLSSTNPAETITRYFEATGKTEAEKQYGANLVKEIQKGEWLKKPDVPAGMPLTIGWDRLWKQKIDAQGKETSEFVAPPELTAAFLILLIESISVFNTIFLSLDDDYKRIYMNKKLQAWGHGYNADLVDLIEKALIEYFKLNPTPNTKVQTEGLLTDAQKLSNDKAKARAIVERLNAKEIKKIVLHYAQHGQLPGQQQLIKNYLKEEFGARENTIMTADKKQAGLTKATVLSDIKLMSNQIEGDSKNTAAKIENEVEISGIIIDQQHEVALGELESKKTSDTDTANHKRLMAENLEKFGWWKGTKLNKDINQARATQILNQSKKPGSK